MLTQNTLVQQLPPLLHPMLVHFPIALLFASVALDWLRPCAREPSVLYWSHHWLHVSTGSVGF